MLKLIVGIKGTGKTKTLIEMANKAIDTAKGNVVFIEKGVKLMYDIKYRVRLVDIEKYDIKGAKSLYGFVSGIAAGDHDLTHMYIDSALKMCSDNVADFEEFVLKAEALVNNNNFECTMTASISEEDLPATLKKFL